MENKNQNPNVQKKHYEPPKAEFVLLKLEERLMACTKDAGTSSCCSIALKSQTIDAS